MMLDLSRMTCLGETLRDVLLKYRSNVAFIEAERDRENARYTYTEVRKEAERFAALLQDYGFKSGDRCAILMSNQSKWPITATGALWTGAILVPIDYKLTSSEQAALLSHAEPKVLVVEWPIWMRLKDESLQDLLVFVTEAPVGSDLGKAVRWETTPGRAFTYVGRSREDVASIVYSSGTGGRPKGCMLTHANYLVQAEELGKLYPIEEHDRYFSILPTNHAIDFMCGFLLPLHFGGAVVHQRTLRPEFLASTMKRYGISHVTLVPMILKALERKIREKIDSLPRWKRTILDTVLTINEFATQRGPNYELSRRLLKQIHQEFGGKLRFIFAGGAFVESSAAQFFYRLGIPVVIGYGLTEAGTTLTLNDLKPFRNDTVGKALSCVSLELRDVNDQGVGEVWAKGPTVMKGYYKDAELTGETIVNGWLRTGDLGTVDASGHLKLVGRSKNMIVTEGGKNIYPEDIENVFADVPGSQEHCVFSSSFVWKNEKLAGEKMILVLRPRSDRPDPTLEAQLRERNQRLTDYKRLGGYVVWEREFPRTASMKLKRDALAEQLAKELNRKKAVREL